MKRSELEKEVKKLGLECEVGNSLNVIMEVWQPHKNDGFKVGSKYYTPDVLGVEEVDYLNSAFESLLDILRDNNIQIRSTEEVENGVISKWLLDIRNGTLSNNETDLDFEIETDIKKHPYGEIEYDYAMPENIGFGAEGYDFDIDSFLDYELEEHEIEMVFEKLPEILERFTDKDNWTWIWNFSVRNQTIEVIKTMIEKHNVAPLYVIEEVFGNESMYFEDEDFFTELLGYLTTLKASDIDINKSSSYRGMLPDIILDDDTMFQNVLNNWEFEFNAGQRVMMFLIQDEHWKRTEQWLIAKDSRNYFFDEWYDLGEYTLANAPAELVQIVFDQGYMDMENISYHHYLEFFEMQMKYAQPAVLMYVLEKYMKYHQKIPFQEFMLEKLLTAFDDNDLHDSYLSRGLMKIYIDNVIDGVSAQYNEAGIMRYIEDGHPLKDKLLADEEFIQYIISVDKLDYLPAAARDIFLF